MLPSSMPVPTMDEHQEDMTTTTKMRIVMFPWLAIGHLIPFLHLSKLLAQKGNHIYYVSTPRNLSRLPKIPSILTSKITLIPLPLPHVPNLPSHAESSTDVSYNDQQLLKKAFDLLAHPLTCLLESTRPEWIIFDYASHWVPSLASKVGIRSAFFSLFTASSLSFVGPPGLLAKGEDGRSRAEDFTVRPSWVPFQTKVVYRLHEVTKYVQKTEHDVYGPNDTVRFGVSALESDVTIIRSSPELEPEWFELLNEIYVKPVIPVGFLPPCDPDGWGEWDGVSKWLDDQKVNSVVYVALGTEVELTREEVRELAVGLDQSGVPFFWVLKGQDLLEMLPDRLEERIKDRGYIYSGWAPQVNILCHESVGGFVTHCGWNSVIEGLAYGRVLVLMPFINDQGLNARLLHEKKLGLEVPREESDGSFTSESVADAVRSVMVEDSGEPWRRRAKEMSEVVGDEARCHRFVDGLLLHLQQNVISK